MDNQYFILFKTLFSLIGMLVGLGVLIWGCFMLAKWLGLIVLGTIMYIMFATLVGSDKG